MAIAVGDLEFRALGPRTGVYAEPSVVAKAAWEFAQTEQMMTAAESLYGPYRWDRYDLLVLPPSFPFGGMENPRLTFATPTVLAGDRSLVALIAHELAHSWSGNLVTNASWNDFWLNEGFTVYFEHRIMEQVYGRGYDDMLAQLGKDGLQDELKQLPPRDTWLSLDLKDRDPDEGLTDVAYEKGYLFLRMLEEQIGREKWDVFLRSYFDQFAFKSMTSRGFVDHLRQQLLDSDPALADQLQIDRWVFGPGLPSNCPEIRAAELARVAIAARQFEIHGDAQKLDVTDWTTHHWLYFLQTLSTPQPGERLSTLDARFQLSKSDNSEILHAWLLHAIAADYRPADEALEGFLLSQGRRKFLRPLYEALCRTDSGRKRAIAIYQRARPRYHAVSTQTVDDIVGWEPESARE
jgi:aminopeptidase N